MEDGENNIFYKVLTQGETVAFYQENNKKATKIIIPASVKKIGKKAFYVCKKLKSITIKSKKLKSKSVGTQALRGFTKKQ